MRLAPARSSASGFSSNIGFPAAAAYREVGLHVGRDRDRDRVAHREQPVDVGNVDAEGAAASSAFAGVRDHTPASSVSGPAANTGPVTPAAHGPAPMSPTRIESAMNSHV